MLFASIRQLGKTKKKRRVLMTYQAYHPDLSKSLMRLWGTWAQDIEHCSHILKYHARVIFCMTKAATSMKHDAVEYDALVEELNLMGTALRNDDVDSARHHQFVATIMLNELVRENKVSEPIASTNDKIILSAQSCIALA